MQIEKSFENSQKHLPKINTFNNVENCIKISCLTHINKKYPVVKWIHYHFKPLFFINLLSFTKASE